MGRWLRVPVSRIRRAAGGLKRISAICVLAAVCDACYPMYKTRRPDAELTVRDASHRALAGARVILITSRNPYGREWSRDTLVTDSTGVARFTRVRAWEREVLMIHGAWIYFWNWCVDAPGFGTVDTRRGDTRFEPHAVIMLTPGTPTGCGAR